MKDAEQRFDAEAASATAFLSAAAGETADLIRAHDWNSTPLGPIERWPSSLKSTTALLLAAPLPIALLWGPEGVMIYNDAYAVVAGGRHPALLGAPVLEGWPEAAAFNAHVLQMGLAGGSLTYKNQAFTLHRHGRPEPVWLDLDYWPVPGDDGRPAGVIATVVETTDRVEADRQRTLAADRLELALAAGGGIGAWDWDVPADRITADERFARLYGVDPERAREGAPLVEFFGAMHPEDRARVEAEIAATLRSGGVFSSEYRLVQPDGEVRWVTAEGRATLSENGEPQRFTGVTFDVTERRRTVDALRDSEERYRALFGESTTGLCIIELKFDADQRPIDYKIVEGNRAFEQLTGLSGVNGRWVSEVAPGLEQHWFDLYGRVALTGEPARFENPADQFGRWYDVQAMRLGAPEARRVAILFNDITTRKMAELRQQVLLDLNDAIRDLNDPAEIAQTSAALLAEALGVSRVGYGVMDTEAETVTIERDFNAPGVQSLAGVIRFRDFGDYIEDLARGDVVVLDDAGADPRVADGGVALDRISARALINLPLMERGKVVALLFVNNATPRRWSEGEVALVREVAERVRTATERARGRLALRRNAARLRFLDALSVEVAKVRGADEILAVTTRMTAEHLKVANCAYADMDADQDGFTIRGDWAEPGMASIAGRYRLADFGALAVQELGAGRPLIINDNLTEIAPEEAATFQAIGIGATICMPLVEGGRLTALMAVHHRRPHVWTADELDTIRQVTERSWAHVVRARAEAELRELNSTLESRIAERSAELQAAHESLRQSQKMEAVGQLTGGIAHDFNNLLAGISGSLELLSKRLSEGRLNGMERYIDAAQGAAQRAAALTQRLLAFSRRQTLDPKPIDANRLVQGMDDLIRRSIGPDIDLEIVGAGGLWATKVDPSQLENALLNLCINARDAMAPNGGRLVIETANKWLDDRASRVHDLAPGQYVSLCVTDTGAGMTPEIQAKVFDPFFTTKPLGQGTGLGLSMIHGFVRQSGGQVRIYSEVGQGTTVCLYLPRYLGEVDDGDATLEETIAQGGRGETILVIDDEATVRMLVAEALGEAGYHVIEAPDGPAALEILQSGRRIDLLISDVGLPGGMNGRQIADAARVGRPDLKVLFITGYAENAAVGNGLLAPGMAVMTKPFVIADLALKVHEMVES
ncbi:GAF domain-containing protein [Brevundimonas sp.]|uniref:GAF domain-containing protein n=1 Tax=Brevundimonas sp. TaxID=1871086 RepID=UPI00199905D0|nr:GAF domain-containing protein [Brevundimonas sp.]MBD3837007.1 GAF domain-containing protein [Brevundimonas sp.]